MSQQEPTRGNVLPFQTARWLARERAAQRLDSLL